MSESITTSLGHSRSGEADGTAALTIRSSDTAIRIQVHVFTGADRFGWWFLEVAALGWPA
ncbi:hypothetical protein ABZU32_02270 [Sphaerisporangium sp. NPDC005288]|uniref:hypothetical protein n=1 Tax=Sphaerisporangium sp. NPDC005288 TaxID=3155114 RepID=UPI0033B3E89E